MTNYCDQRQPLTTVVTGLRAVSSDNRQMNAQNRQIGPQRTAPHHPTASPSFLKSDPPR
jgi:hypothetical protein